MLWRKRPENVAKVGVEGSNPFARSIYTSTFPASSLTKRFEVFVPMAQIPAAKLFALRAAPPRRAHQASCCLGEEGEPSCSANVLRAGETRCELVWSMRPEAANRFWGS